MTILSLIMVIIASAFSIGHRAWERGERDIDMVQRYRSGIDLMVKDISSAYNFRARVSNQWITLFVGKPESVLFISTLPVGFHRSIELGYRQVEYEVRESGDDSERGLIRREYPITNDVPFDQESGMELLVLPWVRSISFEYLYRPQVRRQEALMENDDEWVDHWGGVTGESIDDMRLSLHEGMSPEVSRDSRRFLPTAVKITLTLDRHPLNPQNQSQYELEPIIVPINGHGIFR